MRGLKTPPAQCANEFLSLQSSQTDGNTSLYRVGRKEGESEAGSLEKWTHAIQTSFHNHVLGACSIRQTLKSQYINGSQKKNLPPICKDWLADLSHGRLFAVLGAARTWMESSFLMQRILTNCSVQWCSITSQVVLVPQDSFHQGATFLSSHSLTLHSIQPVRTKKAQIGIVLQRWALKGRKESHNSRQHSVHFICFWRLGMGRIRSSPIGFAEGRIERAPSQLMPMNFLLRGWIKG